MICEVCFGKLPGICWFCDGAGHISCCDGLCGAEDKPKARLVRDNGSFHFEPIPIPSGSPELNEASLENIWIELNIAPGTILKAKS